ncbi:MAG: nuclear transport factor 2 family protein [Actinomycetota bacterium]
MTGSLDDRQAIADVLAEYAYRWDRKDAAGFAELFTDDASMHWVLGGEPVDQAVEGRAEIETYARNAHAGRIGEKQSRHHFTNHVIRALTADTAVSENMLLVTHQAPGEPIEVKSSGWYRIEWAKLDGRWLMARRTLHVDR